jgi:excisionase family DNA binding protein
MTVPPSFYRGRLEEIHDEVERLLYLTGHRKTWRAIKAPQTVNGNAGTNASAASEDGLIEKLRAYNGRPLKTREFADLLGVSKETILRRAKRGVYPSFREGNGVRFNPIALIRYFQNKGVR